MTLQAHLSWNSLDTTTFFNDRLRYRSFRGIFSGGLITPVAGALQIKVGDDDFGAVSHDGMVVWDEGGTPTTLNVGSAPAATTVLWVVCYAKYKALYPPTLAYQVLTDAQYAAHPEKDYLIALARLNMPPAAIDVQPSSIDYTVRDSLDRLGRHTFRGSVANVAALPTGTPTENRDGDIYVVVATHTMYYWNESTTAWLTYCGPSGPAATSISQFGENHKTRISVKSGVITDAYYATGTELGTFDGRALVVEQSTLAATVDIPNLCAVVNGHIVNTPYTRMVLGAAGGAETWDLIWLEVWRESVADPTAELFAPGAGPGQTFAQMSAKFEALTIAPTLSTSSVDVHAIDELGSAWATTKYQLRYASGITAAGYTSNVNAMLDPGVKNLGGNAFTYQGIQAAPHYLDTVWHAAYAAAYDGRSWAIPLFVIRRTPTEAGPANHIKWTRTDDGKQQIFEVYPRTQIDKNKTIEKAVDRSAGTRTNYDARGGTNEQWAQQTRLASGILSGHNLPIVGKLRTAALAANTVRIPAMTVSIHGNLLDIPETDVDLGTAPAGTKRRDLVILSLQYVKYPTGDHVYEPSDAPVAWKITDDEGSIYHLFLNYEVINALTTTDLFTAINGNATWDFSSKVVTDTNTDHGLLEAPTYADSAYRVINSIGVYGIPIALIHRRNSGNYDPDTNANGGGGGGAYGARPDVFTEAVIEKDDILDLRSYVVHRDGDLARLCDETMNRVMTGSLRTAMVPHPLIPDSAGVVHLYADSLTSGGAATAGYHLNSGAWDGARTIWSEAEENEVVAASFMLTPAAGGWEYIDPIIGTTPPAPIISMEWDGNPANPGVVTITAPVNAFLPLNASDSPIWVNGGFYYQNTIDIGNALTNLNAAFNGWGWAIMALDARGQALNVSVDIPGASCGAIFTATNRFFVGYTATYPRGYAGDADGYDANEGTYGTQDKLVRAYSDTLSTDIQVKPPIAYLRQDDVSGLTVTFTIGEIEAACGVPAGTVRVVGLDTDRDLLAPTYDPLDWYARFPRLTVVGMVPSANDIASVVQNAAGDLIFTLTVPLVKDVVEFVFPYIRIGAAEETASMWVELGKGSKSIHGIFAWAEASITVPVSHTGAADKFYIGIDDFSIPSFPGADLSHAFFRRGSEGHDVYCWLDTGAGTYQLLLTGGVATDYSLNLSFPGFALLSNYGTVLEWVDGSIYAPADVIRVYAVVWIPPNSDYGELLLHYQGTPYMGLYSALGWDEERFYGKVEAVSDVVYTTYGPGMRRFNDYSVVVANPQIYSASDESYYPAICPILTYGAELRSPDFYDFDKRIESDLYFHTPQYYAPNATTGTAESWYIIGDPIAWEDLATEQSTSQMICRQRADAYRGGPSNLANPSDRGRLLQPGILIRKPAGFDATRTAGEVNAGATQGMHYTYTTVANTWLTRHIASIIPGESDCTADYRQYLQGQASLRTTGELIGWGYENRYNTVSVSTLLQYTETKGISLVGYLLNTFEEVYGAGNGQPGLVFIVFSDRIVPTVTVPKSPGCVFDSWFPLYRPVLPADHTVYPSTL